MTATTRADGRSVDRALVEVAPRIPLLRPYMRVTASRVVLPTAAETSRTVRWSRGVM